MDEKDPIAEAINDAEEFASAAAKVYVDEFRSNDETTIGPQAVLFCEGRKAMFGRVKIHDGKADKFEWMSWNGVLKGGLVQSDEQRPI